MSGKIKKLEKIMNTLCSKENMQEFVDITLSVNPARLYFHFEDTSKVDHPNYGKPAYLNTNEMNIEEVFALADKYGLERDKSKIQYNVQGFFLGFKLKNYKHNQKNCLKGGNK
ncbi:MAG: hypothetical protein ACP5OG_02940 [Candidatus Nanoarchaeia archaeon]